MPRRSVSGSRRRSGRLVMLVAIGCVIAVSSGCGSVGASSRALWHPDTWAFASRTDEPIVYTVDSPLAIDVESFNGDVIVDVDPRLTTATVTLTREATHGHKRKKESRESLDEISYTVDAVPGTLGPTISVRTWTSHPEPHYQRLHVKIDLPAVDGLRVRTSRGRVFAREVEGAIDIETTQGDVRVMTNYAMTRPVTILNQDADIDYRVRGESSGTIDAHAVRGRVVHRATFGRFRVLSGTTYDTLNATLNEGVNPVVLRTVNGNIRIAIVHNPTAVGARIVEP